MAKYLMRFDDINSRMDWKRFFILKKVLDFIILNQYWIVPNVKI